MGSISEWFKRNWPVFVVIVIAGAFVFYLHWVLTIQIPAPPYP